MTSTLAAGAAAIAASVLVSGCSSSPVYPPDLTDQCKTGTCTTHRDGGGDTGANVDAGGQPTDAAPESSGEGGDAGPTPTPISCSGGGNVLAVKGDPTDPVHPGSETVTAGSWNLAVDMQDDAGAPTFLQIHVGQSYDAFDIAIAAPEGTTLKDGTYADAGVPGQTILTGGLDVVYSNFVDGGAPAGCPATPGQIPIQSSFTIQNIKTSGSNVSGFTATFTEHCTAATGSLVGCVSYGM